MYFKQILNEQCGCASYLIAGQGGEAVVVDPALDIEPYEALIHDRNLRLTYVIDTHIHADHVSGARALASHHGAELCLHESAKVDYPFHPLTDGQELEVGQLRLRILHTPGHRPELISVLVTNPPRSPEASMVLTADSLLVGDVGRPDFGGGDAAAQYDSVTRLLRLPDWVAVFPGHFEGPCGKGMCGRPSTTIGFERLFNPMARLERPQFISQLSTELPARPLNMTAIEATNRGLTDSRWAMPTASGPVPEVDIDAMESRPANSLVVDVREPAEYDYSHILGAINIPQADLASRLDELARDRPLILVCHSGMRAYKAAQFLHQLGYTRAASLKGGALAWQSAGKPMSEVEGSAAQPRVTETDWGHAGGHNFEI